MQNDPTGAPPFDPGQRIIVVGVTCSGKTTLAGQLAERYRLPHVELDHINWQPNWQSLPKDEFRRQVDALTSTPAWVLDGNYRETRDLIWPRATALIWLDFELPFILLRLFRRTMRRILTKEILWGTNRETWRGAFLDKNSLFLYALSSHKRIRSGYPQTLALPVYSHLKVARLKSPAQLDRWWQTLAPAAAEKPASGILIRS